MMFGLIFVIVVYYFFNSSNSGATCWMSHQPHTHTAQDILAERYASGEIDREDYLDRKQELSGQKKQISIKKV